MKLKLFLASSFFSIISQGAYAVPDFCFDPGALFTPSSNTTSCPIGSATGFLSDGLSGNYQEKIIGTDPDVDDNPTRFASLTVLNFQSFDVDDVQSSLGPVDTGLGFTYGLYALVFAEGDVDATGREFVADTLSVEIWLDTFVPDGMGGFDRTDVSRDAIDDDVTQGFDAFAGYTGNTNMDARLAFGGAELDFAEGTIPALNTDGFAIQFSDFTLTNTGETFFTAPDPFHMILFSDGDINSGDALTTGEVLGLGGGANVIFREKPVPLPGTLALAGLGLLVLGRVQRLSNR